MVLFDIDGTVSDMRYVVLWALDSYSRRHRRADARARNWFAKARNSALKANPDSVSG